MPRRRAFTLVELLVVIGIIILLMAMLLPAIQAVRGTARRTVCQNNLYQIGQILVAYEGGMRSLPAGWKGVAATSDRPGWSWAALLLWYTKQAQMDVNSPLDLSAAAVRRQSVALYLCPSDGADALVTFAAGASSPGARAAASRSTMAVSLSPLPSPLLTVARSNYLGVFGTKQIELWPDTGDGVFYRNSATKLSQLAQHGQSNTAVIGERSTRTSAATWVGVIPGADRALARIVGTSENLPNDVIDNDLANFSSDHGSTTNFLFADSSVKAIGDEIDQGLFRDMSTRGGASNSSSGIPTPPPKESGDN